MSLNIFEIAELIAFGIGSYVTIGAIVKLCKRIRI